MTDGKMTAREFLQDLLPMLNRGQLAMVAFSETISAAAMIGIGVSVPAPRWVQVIIAALLVTGELAAVWWGLGFGPVQRWIRGGM